MPGVTADHAGDGDLMGFQAFKVCLKSRDFPLQVIPRELEGDGFDEISVDHGERGFAVSFLPLCPCFSSGGIIRYKAHTRGI